MSLCNGCGAFCCRYYFQESKDVEEAEYLEQRCAFKIKDEDNDKVYYVMHQPCKHIDDNDLCLIYEKRPSVCRKFPSMSINPWYMVCATMRNKFGKQINNKSSYKHFTLDEK